MNRNLPSPLRYLHVIEPLISLKLNGPIAILQFYIVISRAVRILRYVLVHLVTHPFSF